MNRAIVALNLNTVGFLLSLVAIISRQAVYANVILLNASNATIKSFRDFPTNLGPYIPTDGLWGHHMFTYPTNGCSEVSPPPSNGSWFAVIQFDNKCSILSKVLNAQAAGFKAVIIYLNDTSSYADKQRFSIAPSVKIPSTWVEKSSVNFLLIYQNRTDTLTVIYEYEVEFSMFVLLGIAAFVFIVLIGSCLAWVIYYCCRREKSLGILSWWKLKRLAVHTFRTGDTYDACAICLEDYQTGEKLRILPCGHAFHCKCVDVWLTQDRKTCPLCNEAADSRVKRVRHINEVEDERTPLLAGAEDHGNQADGFDQVEVAVRGRTSGGNISQSVVQVHAEPSNHQSQARGYGSVCLHNPILPAELVKDDEEKPLEGPSSCDSISHPAKFYIGTPRSIEATTSVSGNTTAQNTDQQESVSDVDDGKN